MASHPAVTLWTLGTRTLHILSLMHCKCWLVLSSDFAASTASKPKAVASLTWQVPRSMSGSQAVSPVSLTSNFCAVQLDFLGKVSQNLKLSQKNQFCLLFIYSALWQAVAEVWLKERL